MYVLTNMNTHIWRGRQTGRVNLIEALLQIVVADALECTLKISQDTFDVIYTSL